MAAPSERMLTGRQVAERLGLSVETVLRRYRRGELVGYRLSSNVVRFAESDVDAYLWSCRSDAPARTPGGVVVSLAPIEGDSDAR